MDRKTTLVLVVGYVMSGCAADAPAAQQLVVALSQEQIGEAIRLASDDKAADKFLQSYVVQSRSGMGTGPLIGYMSTPFARVVLAARAATTTGKTFSPADVSAELVAPELHVIVLNQTAAYDAVTAVAQVVTVTGGTVPGEALQPTRRAPATDDLYAFYGISRDNPGALAMSFPLDVISPGAQIRVTYSHVVRGSSAITNCKDCVVPLDATRLR